MAGRPTQLSQARTQREHELSERNARRAAYVESHPCVISYPDSDKSFSAVDRLRSVQHQLAREVASMEFNKTCLDSEGKDTSQVSSRIASVLHKLANLDLEIKKMGSTVIDPKSEEVVRMLSVWVSTLNVTLSELVESKTISIEVMDLFVNKFSASLEGWEDRLT